MDFNLVRSYFFLDKSLMELKLGKKTLVKSENPACQASKRGLSCKYFIHCFGKMIVGSESAFKAGCSREPPLQGPSRDYARPSGMLPPMKK